MLQYSAFPVYNSAGLEYNPLEEGAGGINGKGAIDLAKAADTSAPRGTHWLTTTPAPWTNIGGSTITWKQVVVWGSVVVSGSTVEINQPAWGTVVVWGSDNTTFGNVVVWGSNVVWTDPQSWANVVVWGSDSIGTTEGDVVVWGSTGGISPDTTAWGDLNGAQTSGMVAATSVR